MKKTAVWLAMVWILSASCAVMDLARKPDNVTWRRYQVCQRVCDGPGAEDAAMLTLGLSMLMDRSSPVHKTCVAACLEGYNSR